MTADGMQAIMRMHLDMLAEEGRVFFVQIGANDGKHGDPIHAHVVEHGWSGLLVEPLPDVFERLKANYRGHEGLIFDNCAIGPAGTMTLYRLSLPPGEAVDWRAGLASFDRAVIASHEYLIKGISRIITEESVRSVEFGNLMAQHGIETMDLLTIDTEGYDFEILKQVNLSMFRPKLIICEIKHLKPSDLSAMQALLDEYGYEAMMIPGKSDLVAARVDWLDGRV